MVEREVKLPPGYTMTWSGQYGHRPTLRDLYDAVVEGAVDRVRPKMMTVMAMMAGLLPILWGRARVRAS